jgi:Bardet-Biedl syndrome 2 protein
VFQEDAILFDLQETDAIRCLCHLGRNCFAYALNNGTVGVYVGRERVWRIKSKNDVAALAAFDANGDGQAELVTGWSSGKVDVRCVQSGQVLFKEQLKQPVAGLLVADYDQDGRSELLVLTTSGQVRAWQSSVDQDGGAGLRVPSESSKRLKVIGQQQRLALLMRKKQQMLLELRTYESSGRFAEEQRFADEEELRCKARATAMNENFGAIPADTQLKSVLLLMLGDNQSKVRQGRLCCICLLL